MNFIKNKNQPIVFVYQDVKRNNTSTLKYFILFLFVFLIILSLSLFTFLLLQNQDLNLDVKILTKNLNLFEHSDEEKTADNNVSERKYNEYTLSKFISDEINRLGILDIPEGFSVQYEYKGIKFVRTPHKSFSFQQIGILKYFIDLTPKKLLEPGPAAIITFDRDEISPIHGLSSDTIAFASGMYMFFNDDSFNSIKENHFIDNAFATFIHELMHISQFNFVFEELGYEKALETAEKNGYSWVDLVSSSALTRDFADAAGWDYDSEIRDYVLVNKENVRTTEYGKTSIYEDIADSMGAVVTTRFDLVSDSRVVWVLKYLNEDSFTIKNKKLPVYPNSKLVNLEGANFIDTIRQDFAMKYDYVTVSTYYYEEEKSVNNVVNYYENEFKERMWTAVKPISKSNNNIVTYEGEYDSGVRNTYIRIYSYDYIRNGYNISLKGTVIVFVCGFDFGN